MDVDAELRQAGDFGRFQKLLVVFYGTVTGTTAVCFNSYLYTGRAVAPACPPDAQGCDADNVCDFVSGYGPSAPLTTYAVQFDLVCDRAYLLTAATSSLFAGFGVGNWAGGVLSNRHGRRITCVLGALLVPIAHLVMVLCTDVGALIAVRFFLGVFSGVQNVAGWTLLMEYVGSESRAAAGGFLWFVWTCWQCSAALVAYLCDSHAGAWAGGLAGWRATTICLSVPALLATLAALPLLPESPRFLAMAREEGRARAALARVARVNGRPRPVAAPRKDRGEIAAPAGMPALRTADLLCGGATTRGVPISRMILVTSFLWFASTASYYGLSISISDMAGSVYVNNLVGSALEGPAYAFTGFFCEWMGRQRVMLLTLISTGLCCIVLSLAGDTAQVGWRMLSFVAKFGAALAFSSVYVWTAELFPTDARTVAFGLCNAVARTGGILAPVIVQLSSVAAMLPALIFGALSLAGALVCLALPETRGTPLQDHLEPPAPSKRKRRGDARGGSGAGAEPLLVAAGDV